MIGIAVTLKVCMHITVRWNSPPKQSSATPKNALNRKLNGIMIVYIHDIMEINIETPFSPLT